MNNVSFDFNNMPRVEWMGITILEPATVLTNLLITAMCLYAFTKLKHTKDPNRIQERVKYFFLTMGLSTAVGGILGHGFLYITGDYGKLPGWYISMLAVAIMERSAIMHASPLMPAFWGNFFSTFNYLEILIFMVLSFVTLNFNFIEMHATYGLFVVVFSMELFAYLKQKNTVFPYIAGATLLGLVAALIHIFKLGINEWFNFNDVSHLVMVVAIYFYYQASKNFKVYPRMEGSKPELPLYKT